MLTENRFQDNKKDYGVYCKVVSEDRYGNDEASFPDEPDFMINCMWQPVTSELEVAQYGERISEMLYSIVYSPEDITEGSRISINDNMYNILSCVPWFAYRKLVVERVR